MFLAFYFINLKTKTMSEKILEYSTSARIKKKTKRGLSRGAMELLGLKSVSTTSFEKNKMEERDQKAREKVDLPGRTYKELETEMIAKVRNRRKSHRKQINDVAEGNIKSVFTNMDKLFKDECN